MIKLFQFLQVNRVQRTELSCLYFDIWKDISHEELVQNAAKIIKKEVDDVYCIGFHSVACAFLKDN